MKIFLVLCFVASAICATLCTTPARAAAVSAPTLPHFYCDMRALDPVARTRHFDVLGPELRQLHTGLRELSQGYEFRFPADPKTVSLLAEWAAGERLCCPFFTIDMRLEPNHGALWLRLTGVPGTKQFIRAEFERWMPTQPKL